MEDTDPQEMQVYIIMFEKYIKCFRKEIEESSPQQIKNYE